MSNFNKPFEIQDWNKHKQAMLACTSSIVIR